jgi:hypothetical protein
MLDPVVRVLGVVAPKSEGELVGSIMTRLPPW